MHHWSKILICAGVGLVGVACGSGGDKEDVARESEAIAGGVDLGVNAFNAAVYHFGNNCSEAGWFTRPCSGSVVKRTSNATYVLTARHCLAQDGQPNGPLISSTGQVAVSTDLEPGPVMLGGSPPASARPATIVATGRAEFASTISDQDGEDLAIVRVDSRLPLPNGSRFALYPTDPSVLLGSLVEAFGYGRTSLAETCNSNQGSGAGTLRWGGWFQINDSRNLWYEHPDGSSGNQSLVSGDSGGGSFLVDPQLGDAYLVGVHSTTQTDAGGAGLALWLQQKLGNLYLAFKPSGLALGSIQQLVGSGGIPRVNTFVSYQLSQTLDNQLTRVVFSPFSHQIQINGLCIQDLGSSDVLRLESCAPSSNQGWLLLPNQQIQNIGTGRCWVGDGSGTVKAGSCANLANSVWVWLSAPQI